MTANEASHYPIHVIFRGLFVVRLEDVVTVYLTDAREPGNCPIPGGSFREHTPVIELYARDWRNPSDGVLVVDKPRKGRVALHFLNGEHLSLESRWPLETPPIPSAERCRYNRDLELCPDLAVLTDGSDHDIDQLPSYGSAELDHVAAATGTMSFDLGLVRTERRSRHTQGHEILWKQVPLSKLTTNEKVSTAIAGIDQPRPINLDLRVTVLARRDDVVELALSSGRSFQLRPEEGEDLEIWIKNRELGSVLADSDCLPDPYRRVDLRDGIDRDHALHYELSANATDEHILIPVTRDVHIADGASGCGGKVSNP